MGYKYEFLFGLAKMKFPDWETTQWDWRIPLIDIKLSWHHPGWMFSTVFYLGLGTVGYFMGKSIFNLTKRVTTYFKSVKNGNKYLLAK